MLLFKYACHAANTIFGMYHEPYNSKWNEILNRIIDNGEVIDITDYTVCFKYKSNLYRIWCGNKYYSYGNIYMVNGLMVSDRNKFRPRFNTMLKLEQIHESGLRVKNEEARRAIYEAI